MEADQALCRIDRLVTCEGVEVVKHEENTVYLKTRRSTLVAFVHKPHETTVCQGYAFQVHVWGAEKITIWILGEGLIPCVILSNTFFDACDDGIYALSNTQSVCNTLTLSRCEKDLAKALKLVGYPLIILVNVKHPTPLINVVNHDCPDECTEKRSRLLERDLERID